MFKILKTFEFVAWVIILLISLSLIYNSVLIVMLDLGFRQYHPFVNPTIDYFNKYSIHVPKYDSLSASDVIVALVGFMIGLKFIDVSATNMQSCYYTLLSKKLAHHFKHPDDTISSGDLYSPDIHPSKSHLKDKDLTGKAIEKMYVASASFDENAGIDHGYARYNGPMIENENERIRQELAKKSEIAQAKRALDELEEHEKQVQIEKLEALRQKKDALLMPSALSIKVRHAAEKFGWLYDIAKTASHKVGEYAHEQKEALVDKEAMEALEISPVQKKKAPHPGTTNSEKEFLKHPSFLGLIRYGLGGKKTPRKAHRD